MIRINLLPVREARRAANLRKQGVFLGGAVGAGVAISLMISMYMTAHIAHERTLIAAREAELKKLEAVQKEIEPRNADLPENRRMKFRIGVNLGDVIEDRIGQEQSVATGGLQASHLTVAEVARSCDTPRPLTRRRGDRQIDQQAAERT